ncbi:MAG: hypothetical protein ACK5IP_05570 [Paracoccus sp. (in: a-proteobacteria)]
MKHALTGLLLLATPGMAQSVGECTELASARNLQEPWEETTATYANGDIRVAVLDSIEPAAAAVHLMILSPPRDEIGDRQCRLVSLAPADGGVPTGFLAIDFAARSASYDPARGLVLRLPVEAFVPETGTGDRVEMTVIINQSSGGVTADIAGS